MAEAVNGRDAKISRYKNGRAWERWMGLRTLASLLASVSFSAMAGGIARAGLPEPNEAPSPSLRLGFVFEPWGSGANGYVEHGVQ